MREIADAEVDALDPPRTSAEADQRVVAVRATRPADGEQVHNAIFGDTPARTPKARSSLGGDHGRDRRDHNLLTR